MTRFQYGSRAQKRLLRPNRCNAIQRLGFGAAVYLRHSVGLYRPINFHFSI
jgi:hypothetical protein